MVYEYYTRDYSGSGMLPIIQYSKRIALISKKVSNGQGRSVGSRTFFILISMIFVWEYQFYSIVSSSGRQVLYSMYIFDFFLICACGLGGGFVSFGFICDFLFSSSVRPLCLFLQFLL
jgi:hypothetical protein